MSTLSYYVPDKWKLLAEIDESEPYEVDVTEIYQDAEGKFILATASGCSCWGGEYDSESFDSLEALGTSMIKDDRQYNPSFRAANELMELAQRKLAESGIA
jgi:hypothetical protein